MCVCFWDPCALKFFVESYSWELKMLFGSLVELHTWLHSCMCFSPLKKLFLKSWLDTSSIASYLLSFLNFFLLQSWQHLNTWWIDWESFWPLDSSSTPGGSIEYHILLLVFFFLDSFSTHDLSTLLFLDTFSTTPRHLIYQELLMVYIFSSCDLSLISVDFSLDTSNFSSPKPLSLTPNLFPWDFQVFSSLSSLGKLLISFIYMRFMFWNLGFGVFEKI